MNLGIPKSPFWPNHASFGFADSSATSAHFMARCSACRPSMPNTYLGRRQLVFIPVICSGQPQSEPGTGRGTPIVSTTRCPLADSNTRRAAIRLMVRGAAKDSSFEFVGCGHSRGDPQRNPPHGVPQVLAATEIGEGGNRNIS
jgi:hypothetical protein